MIPPSLSSLFSLATSQSGAPLFNLLQVISISAASSFITSLIIRRSSVISKSSPPQFKPTKKLPEATSDLSSDSEDDDSPIPSDAGEIDFRNYGEFKMVFIIRNDLGMTKGKVAAQCCHACLACYKIAAKVDPLLLKAWEYSGQPKVTLKCNSEDELLQLQTLASEKGLVARSIRDAGRTQIAAGSRTVLAIGPGPVEIINQVSGHLKLY
ncbi:peptidyl-tRNA hydrolase PTH2-domain-containing protein [Paraphysoderma sedebokerense]|nr:peptidyl-tRNA hydrolase PTH2-domain-containing protein [Paraphysoderma sedebokerense]